MTPLHRLALAALTVLACGATTGSASAGIWTPLDSGLGAGASDIIKSIDYQSASRFWYVTSSGKFGYREGGIFKLGVPATPTVGVSFTEVAFDPTSTTGIAVGTNGNVWRSTDGGKNWAKVAISTPNGDCGVYGSPTIPMTANPGVIRTVAWGSGNTVWIGGDKATLQRSINGGASFTEINKIVVADAPGQRVTCRLDSNIGNVTALNVPAATPQNARPLYFLGVDGYIWFSSDGLSSTAVKKSFIGYGGAERYKLAVDSTNPNRLWAMTSDISDAVFPSTDGGSTYGSSMGSGIRNEEGASLVSPQDFDGAGQLTLAVVGKAGGILNSLDGTNWYYQRADGVLATKDWYAVSGFDAANFAVGGAGGTLITTAAANTIPLPVVAPPPPPPPPVAPPPPPPPPPPVALVKKTTVSVPGAKITFGVPNTCVRPLSKFRVRLTWKRQTRRGNVFVKVRRTDFYVGTRRVKIDKRAPFTQILTATAGAKSGSTITVRARAFIKVTRGKSPTKSITSKVRVC